MPFTDDRGRIVRITFEIVYPTGQLVTVAMDMSDSGWGDTALIALSEEGVRGILAPGLAAGRGESVAADAVASFDAVEAGATFKPAMLVVSNDATVVSKCSKYCRPDAEQGDPIGRFMAR